MNSYDAANVPVTRYGEATKSLEESLLNDYLRNNPDLKELIENKSDLFQINKMNGQISISESDLRTGGFNDTELKILRDTLKNDEGSKFISITDQRASLDSFWEQVDKVKSVDLQSGGVKSMDLQSDGGKSIDLQLFVYDNIGKGIKENIPIESVAQQAKPLLEVLKNRLDTILWENDSDKNAAYNNIKTLQDALNSKDPQKVLHALKDNYSVLINKVHSRNASGYFKPSHIIAQDMRTDPFFNDQFFTGKNLYHGWRVITSDATSTSPKTPFETYSDHVSSPTSTPSTEIPDITSSVSKPFSGPKSSKVPFSDPNFLIPETSINGGLGEAINKGGGEISSLSLNARTGDFGMSDAHPWPQRAKGMMNVINGSGADFINLQEVDNNKRFPGTNGLTQAEYIIANLDKSKYAIIPDKPETGLMIIYNKKNFKPVGQPVIKDLGYDHEGFDKNGKLKPGQWHRQLLAQKFKINGTNPEQFFVQGTAHGPHIDPNNPNKATDAVRNALWEIQNKNFPGIDGNIAGDWNMDPEEMMTNRNKLAEIAKTSAYLPGRENLRTKTVNWNDPNKKPNGNNDTQFYFGPTIQGMRGTTIRTSDRNLNLSDHDGDFAVLKKSKR